MRDFLLEIGFEEIPAPHLAGVAEHIRQSFEQLMQECRLEYGTFRISYTPRRFFLLATSIQERQPDITINRTGPAKRIAYDDTGNLTPAAMGFLKKNSASAEDIRIECSDKGEFISLTITQHGRETKVILSDWIEKLILGLPFQKTMIWNESRLALARPLRWLCALWGSDALDSASAGISSGRITFGNRYLGLDFGLEVSQPGEYLSVLRKQAVLADRNERRDMLVQQLAQVLAGTGLNVVPDERLIDTVTDLVEHPTAVVAEFAAEYLILPEKIITSTISQNQKYFSVQDENGILNNKFVFVSNGDPQYSDIIRKGNEKVVSARLADALWYFKVDTQQPLEQYLPLLKDVVFQSKLGTIEDKSSRINKIAAYICANLHLEQHETDAVTRTAALCKADLVTTMLGEKEFTKLQGYIGKQYALAGGEAAEIAEGIYEHYMPRGSNDSLPVTVTGAVVAVADKLDSVCGIIGIGMLPTGSADPFALRRAANGVVQIILSRAWDLNFPELLHYCLSLVQAHTELVASAKNDVETLFLQRVEWFFGQNDISYDVTASVLQTGLRSIPDMFMRAKALQQYRSREDFIRLVIGFKRVANIIGAETDFASLDQTLFTAEEEKELFNHLQILKAELADKIRTAVYSEAISLLVSFGAHIDRFFDAVLVNCDDLKVRANRYSLLRTVKDEFDKIADISKIVVENEAS
jgi:glycyl-tRNA synthetase beta chain